MGIFSKPSKNIEADMEVLKQKIVTLESRLDILETQQKNLRGIINRKLGGEREEREDLNSSVILPTDGNFKFNR